MFEAPYEASSSLCPSSKIIASFSLFLAILTVPFCWNQWKLRKVYRQFPSLHLDIKWLYTIIAGRYRKDVPPSSILFQKLIEDIKRFQDEGTCVSWYIRPYVIIFSDDFTKIFFNETSVINKGQIYDVMKGLFGNGLIGSKDAEIWKVHRKLLNPAFSLGVLKGKMHIFNENGFDLAEKLQAIADTPTEAVLDILKTCAFNIMAEESRFCVQHHGGGIRVWRHRGKRTLPACIRHRHTGPTPGVMVSGAFGYTSRSPLVRIAESVLDLNTHEVNFGTKARDFMENIDKATKFLVYRMVAFWLQWDFLLPLFRRGREYKQTIYKIRQFTREIIEKVKESIEVSKNDTLHFDDEEEIQESFAQILFKTHLQDPNFTLDDVQDHLINIMAGGFDTTSHALMWCLYILGRHQQEQENAYIEIMSVAPLGDVTYNDLGKLKYLDCVLKETLRLYPVVPFHSRELKRDVQCGKYTVPKGAELVFCTFLLHRNPHIYPDPEKFDPERFADTSSMRPWTFMPFSEGYRSCIGKRFAMMEMKVLLAHVLRRFKITALNKMSNEDLDWSIVLKPTKPPLVLLTNR